MTIEVFDLLGKKVATLVNKEMKAGTYKVEFNASTSSAAKNLSSGIYFYRISAVRFVQTKKMILLR